MKSVFTWVFGACLVLNLSACTEEKPVIRKHEAKFCNPYTPAPAMSIDEVLEGASLIVMATVTGNAPNHRKIWLGENVIYDLLAFEILKGDLAERVLKLEGVKISRQFPFDPTLFDATMRHAEGLLDAKTEADARIVRQKFVLTSDPKYCEYAPYFDVGLNYLVIVTEPYSVISFEPILSTNDAWLRRVETKYWTPEQSEVNRKFFLRQ